MGTTFKRIIKVPVLIKIPFFRFFIKQTPAFFCQVQV